MSSEVESFEAQSPQHNPALYKATREDKAFDEPQATRCRDNKIQSQAVARQVSCRERPGREEITVMEDSDRTRISSVNLEQKRLCDPRIGSHAVSMPSKPLDCQVKNDPGWVSRSGPTVYQSPEKYQTQDPGISQQSIMCRPLPTHAAPRLVAAGSRQAGRPLSADFDVYPPLFAQSYADQNLSISKSEAPSSTKPPSLNTASLERCLQDQCFRGTVKDLTIDDHDGDSVALLEADAGIDPMTPPCFTMQTSGLVDGATAVDQIRCLSSSKDTSLDKTSSPCRAQATQILVEPPNASRPRSSQCTQRSQVQHQSTAESAAEAVPVTASHRPSDLQNHNHEADKCQMVSSQLTALCTPTRTPILVPAKPQGRVTRGQAHPQPLSMARMEREMMLAYPSRVERFGRELHLDTRFAESATDRPMSPGSEMSSPETSYEGYDTPMTSPCVSPVAPWPRTPESRPSSPCLGGFDGARDHDGEHDELQSDNEAGAGSIFANAVRLTPPKTRSNRSTETREKTLPDLTAPSLPCDETRSATCIPSAEGDTPLVSASIAKGAEAFPFPDGFARSPSLARLSRQRQPSALLQHCERTATARQRSLMAGVLQTPDRFITARRDTPTKDALFLRTGKSKHSVCDDPFGPGPSLASRATERFATIRSIPSPSYPHDVFGNTLPMTGVGSPTRTDSGPEAVWTVGGTVVTEGVASTTNGRGGRVTSGTSAPHHTVDFIRRNTPSEQEAQHGQRLAAAMEVSTDDRMLPHSSPMSSPSRNRSQRSPIGDGGTRRTFWSNSAWEKDIMTSPTKSVKPKVKDVPVIPFRVLDAPALRDDYYCSLLAYSPTLQCLAVGLGPHVYLWSEHRDTAPIPEPLTAPFDAHVTSLSFSSNEGGSAILAIGRADGRMNLWSPKDPGDPRFDIKQPSPISCVSFRPTTVKRRSIRELSEVVPTEELLIGDETGNVYMYAIEWPSQERRDLFDWHGSMTMLAKFTCHTQQVCGIAWSRSGCTFATGGNDNTLFVFDSKKLFAKSKDTPASNVTVRNGNASESDSIAGQGEILAITPGRESKLFNINAACKAIAFAPWQSSLIAARGGSNDRCIHFYHAQSGATLATIDCLAQVTSLTWSETRSEIAATFGFAQPEHPYRVAVFSWPSCQEIVKIPWVGEERALYAIAYPGGPSVGPADKKKAKGDRETGYGRRTREEGCLVIATSDASIKFHEIWPEGSTKSKRISGGGLLGGSQILEDGISEELERKSAIR